MCFHRGPNRVPVSRSEDWPVQFGDKRHNYRLAGIGPVHRAICIMSVDVIHVLDQRSLQAADCAAFGLSRSGAGGLQSPLSSMMPYFRGYPERPFRSAKTVLAVVRLKFWLGSSDPYQSIRLMSQPSAIMNESCALTVADEFSL